MLAWKNERKGSTALLVKGARRVGKSTLVEQFAKEQYRSYILVDFAHAPKNVTACLKICMIWTSFLCNYK